MKYVIFQTKWGHFGLAGKDNNILYRTILPQAESDRIKTILLKDYPDIRFDTNYLKNLQKQIIDYFKGKKIDFNTNISVSFDHFSEFSYKILDTCRNIKYGQVITYADLAQKAKRPKSSRAAGNVLAKNPMPLIIPCHRVIRTDGNLGGFSALGGTKLKKRLLSHENLNFHS